jgi:hypothetical protein
MSRELLVMKASPHVASSEIAADGRIMVGQHFTNKG